MSDVAPELPASPWTGRAGATAGTAALISLAVVVLGWERVSNEATLEDAQPWFVVGIVGLLIGFGTAVLWLNSAARRIRAVRLDCHALLRRGFADEARSAATTEPFRGLGRYVRVRGMVKVHLDTCELVAGKSYDELADLPVDAECCGMCRP